MCGRYSLIADINELEERFGFVSGGLTHVPNYNVAPTQNVLTVVNREEREATHMRWGLIPSWAKSASVGIRMINARAETVAERNSFRTAFRRRRCLILADGFYEWQRNGSKKRPLRITMADGEPFAFAGLWETWKDPEGELVRSCAIITTEANDLVRPIHDRMPVILPRELEDLWLDTNVQEPVALSQILTPYPGNGMDAYEVSPLVNSVRNNVPELIVPVCQTVPPVANE